MEHDAADELHPEGAHAEHAVGGLPDGGKGLGQDVVRGLPRGEAVLEFLCFRLELLVRQGAVLVLQRLDFIHDGTDLFQLPVGMRAEDLLQKCHVYRLSDALCAEAHSNTYYSNSGYYNTIGCR